MNLQKLMSLGVAVFLTALTAFPAWPLTKTAEELMSVTVLDRKISDAMASWQIPGLAVVVVKDGKTVLLKGYGTRHYGQELEIDEKTYLQIASNSKLFAAYSIGMLVDDGKLNWDDPVKKHIPELALPDPFVEENVSVDDLLSHRSGLTAAPLGGFQNSNYTMTDLLANLETTPLSTRFRAKNNYSQVGMALLGEIVERESGMTWGDFVRQRIFEPLDMNASHTSTTDFQNRVGVPALTENIMMPVVMRDAQVTQASWDYVGTTPLYAPAGGIITNLADMSAWIRFRLDDGALSGDKLISSDSLNEIRTPRLTVDMNNIGFPNTYLHPHAKLVDVGFGHISFEHRGQKVIMHNGGWMTSVVALMPDENIGIGIFSNAWFDEPTPWTSAAFVNALVLDMFDHYLDQPHDDWTGRMRTIVTERGTAESLGISQ